MWVCPPPKNFSTSPAAIFASPVVTEKLIKAEGLFLVKLTRVAIQDSRVAAPLRWLSFITEFVEDSFDAAPSFSVLKNGSRRLSDFPGHFFWSREDPPAGFCVILGSRELGEGRLG